MVTLARDAIQAEDATVARSVDFAPPHAHGQGAHGQGAHGHVHAPRLQARMSLLRMGLSARLAFAAGATLVLWSAIALGLS